jgi:hypothetical protein
MHDPMCSECDIKIAHYRHLWRLLEHKWSDDVPAPDLKYINGPGTTYLTEAEWRAMRHPEDKDNAVWV